MSEAGIATNRSPRRSFGELVGGYGFLTDQQIRAGLENGYLIDPGTCEMTNIRHASYTLRLGRRTEVAAAARSNAEARRDFNLQEIRDGEFLELQPGDTAKLYSLEILRLPSDVLAFTVARGLMFVESLVPENTYADPGFGESLYVTVTNLSNRIVRLQYGDPIARIFFYRLGRDVEEPFRSGAARGIRQRLESRRATEFGTSEECSAAAASELLRVVRQIPLGGNPIAVLIARQNRHLALVAAAAISWPVLLLLANRSAWLQGKLGDVLVNLVASAIFLALIGAANWLWERATQSK